MDLLIDKLLLFAFCTILYVSNEQGTYTVVLLISVIIFATLVNIIDREYFTLAVFLAAVLAGLFVPGAILFLPVFVYDIMKSKYQWFLLLATIPLIAPQEIAAPNLYFVALLILLSLILKYRSSLSEKRRHDNHLLRDELTEKQLLLENANRDLLEKQDYEVHLATLKERNRISSELHDSIGHVLTRSLLQTGALIAVCRDEDLKKKLLALQESLSGGMDEVRTSIHDLHDDAFDLESEVRKQIQGFLFCPVSFRCQMDVQPDKKIRYALLSVIKEGLSNIARHSNATAAQLTLIEHPAFYQMVLKDNGTGKKTGEVVISESEGMGLSGIKKRVDGLGGHFTAQKNPGFEIFITVPKEKL